MGYTFTPTAGYVLVRVNWEYGCETCWERLRQILGAGTVQAMPDYEPFELAEAVYLQVSRCPHRSLPYGPAILTHAGPHLG